MNIGLLAPGLLALSALSFLMVGCSAFDPRYGPESAKFRSAYWNSWFQDSRNGRLQDTLRVGREYEFMLDLSPYSYVQPGIRHKEVSPSLSEELKRQGDKLTVYVKPVLAGRGLEFLPGEAKTRRLTIDLKRIREPAGYKEGELLSTLSKRVSAGSVTISLKTTEPGCAVVALSLWNQQLDRPLDHITHPVLVTDEKGKGPPCPAIGDDRRGSKKLRVSLLPLLSHQPDRAVDAALHIFEMEIGDETHSVAIYKDRFSSRLYAWPMEETLSEFMKKRHFRKMLDRARRKKDYTGMSRQLTNALFNAVVNSKGQEEADAAREALARLAKRFNRPVFFSRLVDDKGRHLYLPLGLLNPGTGILGETTTLVQPLPRESYEKSRECLAEWTMVLPDKLGEEDSSLLLESSKVIPQRMRITSIEEFSQYMEATAPPVKPEGLLILAHHQEGQMWFEDEGNTVSYHELRRQYAPGSVAVLVMSVAGEIVQDRQRLRWLRKLNSRGVDAVILPSFEVPPTLGVGFAWHFVDQVMRAYNASKPQRDQETPDLAQLFGDTVEAISTDQELIRLIGKEMVHEFLLVGNPGLSLCPP